jgi:hypothetical protein
MVGLFGDFDLAEEAAIDTWPSPSPPTAGHATASPVTRALGS